jgi:DNA-binding MarR family transcriptional regulator
MKPCEEEEPIGRLVYYTAQDIRNMAEKILYPYDLTLEQMHLLKNLPLKSGITQKALGSIINKAPANLTRMLDRLETKTLIIRKPDPGDRRAYLIFLTDKGMDLTKQVHDTFQTFSSQLLQGIDLETQQTVRTCLNKMTQNIEQMALKFKKEI